MKTQKTIARRGALLVLVSAVLAMASVAGATLVKPMSLEALIGESDVIVHATVESQTVTWASGDERAMIHTLTELRVIDALKGDAKANDTVLIRQLGGEIGEEAILVEGNAQLVRGEEVVIFLDRDERAPLHYVVGMAQGKYHVDTSTQPPTLHRDLDGLSFLPQKVVPGAEALAQPRGAVESKASTVTLEDFKARVRAVRP